MSQTADGKTNLGARHRSALGDLLHLAAEGAASETEFEHAAAAELQALDEWQTRMGDRLGRRRGAEQQQQQQRSARQGEKIGSECAAEVERLTTEFEAARIDAVRPQEAQSAKIQTEYDRALAKVNSAFEEVERKIAIKREKNQRRLSTLTGTLDEVREEVERVLRRFRLRRLGRISVEPSSTPGAGHPEELLAHFRQRARDGLESLQRLILPRLVSGLIKPLLITALCCAASVWVIFNYTDARTVQDPKTALALGVTFGVVVVIVVCLKLMAYTMTRSGFVAILSNLAAARHAVDQMGTQTTEMLLNRRADADRTRQSQVQSIRSKFEPKLTEVAQQIA